jgi:hypothetical protein
MTDIKKIKPNRKSAFKQSYFEPRNIQKYLGSFPIICRSSWERKFAIFCDTNDKVVKWSSEPVEIKYYNTFDNKFHKYYPDYFIQINRDGIFQGYLVEVKPHSQLIKPTPPKRLTEKTVSSFKRSYQTYVTNLCKMDALKKYAEGRNMKVLIITEKSSLI